MPPGVPPTAVPATLEPEASPDTNTTDDSEDGSRGGAAGPPGDDESSNWLIYVIIAASALAVIGIAAAVFLCSRRKEPSFDEASGKNMKAFEQIMLENQIEETELGAEQGNTEDMPLM
eukprot:TRINITY_DN17984_c0_g1_i1.p2 TRINITY_DN17984_c0_g1~~TRINITY_DN17984_c0_g1_i1.p2  ORF type:complete len:118 (+),score=43.86 TRINITY_DN17984_c0_g1_i1:2-355(+)